MSDVPRAGALARILLFALKYSLPAVNQGPLHSVRALDSAVAAHARSRAIGAGEVARVLHAARGGGAACGGGRASPDERMASACTYTCVSAPSSAPLR